MQFHGFANVAAYERECARCGMRTERRSYRRDGVPYMLLLTLGPGLTTWYLFTADESAVVLSGIVPDAEWLSRTGGVDRNFTGLLAESGYFPDDPPADDPSVDDGVEDLSSPADPSPEWPPADDGAWEQLALFS